MDLPDGPFTTAEASALSLTRPRLSRLVRSGELIRPFRGVYHPASLPDSLELRAACARLVLPSHVVAVDRTAAWLQGVDVLRFPETRLLPRLEVVSIRTLPTRRSGMYGGQRELQPDELVDRHGIQMTSPVRTAVDLACLRGPAQALAAVESLMHQCGLSTSELQHQLRRHVGRRGIIQARAVVSIASPLSDSPGESFVKWFLHDAGMPPMTQQFALVLPAVGEVFLDFSYPELKIAVEYDGEEFHGKDQQAHDQRRRAALRLDGWLVIVVRKEDLAAAERERWISELAAAVCERAPQFRRTFPAAQPFHR